MRSSSLSEFLTYVVSARIGGKGRKGEERGGKGKEGARDQERSVGRDGRRGAIASG